MESELISNEGSMGQFVKTWLSKKRIAISLLVFTALIYFNLFVRQTIPYAPFDTSHMVGVGGTALVCIGLFCRSWAAGTLHKSAEVTNVGPYALVRNPLYVGSFMMMVGFCILMKDWLALAFVVGPLGLIYYNQIRVEEVNLAKWFGTDWERYTQTTGRILPTRLSRKILAGWSAEQWFKNREYNAFAVSCLALGALQYFFLH